MEQPAPPPPPDEGPDDQRCREDGDDLGDRDGQLAYGDRDQRDDVSEVVAEAGVRPLGELDEHQQHECGHAPNDEVDHVARMAEVSLARGEIVD